MRLVGHPNVVDLKAFFYSNGDKVSQEHSVKLQRNHQCCDRLHVDRKHQALICLLAEGRSIPQSRSRIRPGNRIPGVATLFEAQTDDADTADQAVHVPGEIACPPDDVAD